MSNDEEKFLVSFDADRIKDYIFASNALKDIRGASSILLEIDEQKKREGAQQQHADGRRLIYAAGGGGAIVLDDELEAGSECEKIEREFSLATSSSTITTIKKPVPESAVGTSFGAHMAEAAAMLQDEKARKSQLLQIPLQPYMRPCDACGVAPAAGRAKGDLSGDLLCVACRKKRRRGLKIRGKGEEHQKEIQAKEKKESETEFSSYRQRFLDHLTKAGLTTEYKRWQNARVPDDLNELGALDGKGYVGFLTMDGNRMGKLLEVLGSDKNYTDYSERLKSTVEGLVFEALADLKPEPAGDETVMPFEIVMIGGDDVMLFTSARHIIDVTCKIVQRFEKKSPEVLDAALRRENFFEELKKRFIGDPPIDENEPFLRDGKLTMSAGIAICHANFPLPVLVGLGEALLSNAKKACASIVVENLDATGPDDKVITKPYVTACIDFEVVTGSLIDLDITRKHSPACRPYQLDRFKRLLDYARKVKQTGIPQTQLQIVYDACHSGNRVDGTMATLRMISHLGMYKQRKLIQDFLQEFIPLDTDNPTIWPWTHASRNQEENNA
ncbi:MAG: hypothetical protein ACE5HO_11340, partial [bacterium]